MLEKLIIAGSIALVMSVYPAVKIYQGAKIPMYQSKITKLEHQMAIVKLTEGDPAARYVKLSKLEGKILKLRSKIAAREQIKRMEAKWEYEESLLKLKRAQVAVDSSIKIPVK